MGRTAQTKLDSKTARADLKPRSKPYTQTIAPRRMLGYVRAAFGAGRWLAIVEIGRGETGAALRRQGNLGLADDVVPAGDGVLSFPMAFAAAAAWQPEDGPGGGKITVRTAIKSYVKGKHAAAGKAAAGDAEGRLRLHVLREDLEGKALTGPPGLGDREIAALTLTELREWRDELVTRKQDSVSRSTANRIMANLKAALSAAYSDLKNGIPSDRAWASLESFEDADIAREDHFEAVDVQKLVNETQESDPRFAELIGGGFLTGARYGELTACDVRHFDARHGTVTVASRKGRGKRRVRAIVLTADGIEFFKTVTQGRDRDAPLFRREDGERWGKSEQHRRMKRALKAAELSKSASFNSLRHSHISRSIEEDVPLFIIARNCGTSEAMIRKHYAHLLAKKERPMLERAEKALKLIHGGKAA